MKGVKGSLEALLAGHPGRCLLLEEGALCFCGIPEEGREEPSTARGRARGAGGRQEAAETVSDWSDSREGLKVTLSQTLVLEEHWPERNREHSGKGSDPECVRFHCS